MKKLATILVALIVLTTFFLLTIPQARAQSVTTVEVYGDVPATQAYSGLGSNLTQTNAWEYTALAAMHGTWARSDCGWTGVELTKGIYSMPAGCTTALNNAATSSVHQMFNADYGSPWTTIATGTTAANVLTGATSIQINVSTGSLSGVIPGQTELLLSPQWSTSHSSYSGVLITAISGTTLTLAAASTSGFSSGTAVQVNLLFYPPVFIPAGQGYKAYQSNLSVQAYAGYAHYLASQINSAGQTGQVSIWNEPPWGPDPWDQAPNLYTTPPANGAIDPGSPGLGIELPEYLQNLGTAVAGVPLDNGYTEVAGFPGTLFFSNWIAYQQNLFHTKAVFSTESFHPYGNNPEDAMWLGNSCLYANLSNYTNLLNNCTPTGAVSGAAQKLIVAASFQPTTFGGLNHDITETGFCRCNSPTPSETQIARWNLRQFLGFQALGITPIMFYRMFGDANWQWFTNSTTPLPVYTAFQGLMTDISAISTTAPAPSSPCMMPRVSSFTGFYPLATLTFVGHQSGNAANSLLYYTWQRTYGATWQSVSSPSAVAVSIVIPTGLTVSSVKDLVTGSAVSFTFSSQTLSYSVADNPIEVLIVPASSATQATLTCT